MIYLWISLIVIQWVRSLELLRWRLTRQHLLKKPVGIINDVGEINYTLVYRNKSNRERSTDAIDSSLVYNIFLTLLV